MTGTYTVQGDQMTTILKSSDGKEKKETVTISELTAKKFVTTEDEDGKKVTTEFKEVDRSAVVAFAREPSPRGSG